MLAGFAGFKNTDTDARWSIQPGLGERKKTNRWDALTYVIMDDRVFTPAAASRSDRQEHRFLSLFID